ncbi:AAA family ATPase [Nocardia sp. GCM10030253]|uniref:AAA family ATPase n=1 Tax=Nocardia sp. GCM10030253 TaxID=3273404 RepID=UPI0036334E86
MAEDKTGSSLGEEVEDDLALVDGAPDSRPTIQHLSVVKLFGRYTYDLTVPKVDGDISRLVLLHGDNGSGKTTVLNMLWHTLSTAEDRGHKSELAKTPFRRFIVDFSDGSHVSVEKRDGLVGDYDLTVFGPGMSEPVIAEFRVDAEMDVGHTEGYGSSVVHNLVKFGFDRDGGFAGDRPESPVRAAMKFLKNLNRKSPVLLGDDRGLHSDNRPTARMRRRRQSIENMPSPGEQIAIELDDALARLNDRMLSLTAKAQRSGLNEEATIYMDVLRRLGEYEKHEPDFTAQGERMSQLLTKLGKEVPRFSEYGLISGFEAGEIQRLIDRVPGLNRQAAYSIVFPYLDSVQARLAALNEAESLIRRFVTHANSYLTDKYLTFGLGSGFRVLADVEPYRNLRATSLSSGEKQMLLLLCSAVLSRWDSRLFLIDEPELSLGVLWQRQILKSLLEITEDTSIQFIVATHSIEMVNANAPALVRLVNSVESGS